MLAWLWGWLALHQEDPEVRGENSPQLRTSRRPNFPPCHPLSTPLGQVLPLRNQPLVNRTGKQCHELMNNPMKKVNKVLVMLHVRIQSAKLTQDASLGIATFALYH